MNFNRLRGRMREKCVTQEALAKELNLSPCTVSQKLSGVRAFNLDEAEKICSVLQIETGQFGEYFFVH